MIIGLMGYAQTGKDTTAELLVGKYDFKRVAFADVLRDCLYALNPVVLWPGHTVGVSDVKTVVDQNGWEWAKAHTSVRELLQRLGTEVGRNILGQDIWVNTALARIDPELNDYVFTDVRFPNECKAITDHGGQLWRIKRRGFKPVNAHPSETAVDHIDAHHTINNDGGIPELHKKVRQVLALEALKSE